MELGVEEFKDIIDLTFIDLTIVIIVIVVIFIIIIGRWYPSYQLATSLVQRQGRIK